MTARVEIPAAPEQRGTVQNLLIWASIAGLVYLLLLAVGMIGSGFKAATGGHARELFEFASNPLMGLMIGTVATALIQSSSTVTSIIVGLVAGGLPVTLAVPMVMGANIGTTITNTLVSLGHVRSREAFQRAFSAATVHDFFNLFAVVLFLPLEILFGLLEKAGGALAGLLVGGASVDVGSMNFIKPITKPVIGMVKDGLAFLGSEGAGVALVAAGVLLIFVSITLLGKLLKQVMVGRAKHIFHTTIGRGPVSGIASGATVTVLVQSSSTTTSLVVPLVGTGIFRMRDIYPFTLGANIGTCVTAMLAATAVSGASAVFALQIALVHLIYNTAAVLVIYGVPALRKIPPRLAEGLAVLAGKNKLYVLAYIGGVYFLAPLLLVYFNLVSLLVAVLCVSMMAYAIRKGWFADPGEIRVSEDSGPLGLQELERRCEALLCRLPAHYLPADLQTTVLHAWRDALAELRSSETDDQPAETLRKQQLVVELLGAGPDLAQAAALPIETDAEGVLARERLKRGQGLILHLLNTGKLNSEQADQHLQTLEDLGVETHLEVMESDVEQALRAGDPGAAIDCYKAAIVRLQDAQDNERFHRLIEDYGQKIAGLRKQPPVSADAL